MALADKSTREGEGDGGGSARCGSGNVGWIPSGAISSRGGSGAAAPGSPRVGERWDPTGNGSTWIPELVQGWGGDLGAGETGITWQKTTVPGVLICTAGGD